MSVLVLGAGLSGLCLAYHLKSKSILIEARDRPGGLCKSHDLNGIKYDIGPHILFSKDKKALAFLTSLSATNKIRRSNRIIYKGRLVKYPFENDLSSLPESDRVGCLNHFLNNPYEGYEASNMLQFFLKTFGQGITKAYLQPYNEKIWKYDPSYMDTQMVERIPKPPKEDIIASAKGEQTEGYTHQLIFDYPVSGAIESLIDSLVKKTEKKSDLVLGAQIKKIEGRRGNWTVKTDKKEFSAKTLVNTMPLPELFRYIGAEPKVREALKNLRFNSICIVAALTRKHSMADHFAYYVPDSGIIFHRLSNISYLGKNYGLNGQSLLLAEITYRKGSEISSMSDKQIRLKVLSGLKKLDIMEPEDLIDIRVRHFKYAYVIYDLKHRKNVDTILKYLRRKGIYCLGRFAEFEYHNMDDVAKNSKKLAEAIDGQG